MAKRYSGDLQITVVYDDYRASVSRGGVKLWRGAVRPPRHLTYAVDSEHGYDEAARAALAFADHDRSAAPGNADETTPRWTTPAIRSDVSRTTGRSGRVVGSSLADSVTARPEGEHDEHPGRPLSPCTEARA